MSSFDMGSRFSHLANVSSPPHPLSPKNSDHSDLIVPLRISSAKAKDAKMTVPNDRDYESDASSDIEVKRKRRERAKKAKVAVLGGDEEVWDEAKVAARVAAGKVKVTESTAAMPRPDKKKAEEEKRREKEEKEKETGEPWMTATGKKGGRGILKEDAKPVVPWGNEGSNKYNQMAAESYIKMRSESHPALVRDLISATGDAHRQGINFRPTSDREAQESRTSYYAIDDTDPARDRRQQERDRRRGYAPPAWALLRPMFSHGGLKGGAPQKKEGRITRRTDLGDWMPPGPTVLSWLNLLIAWQMLSGDLNWQQFWVNNEPVETTNAAATNTRPPQPAAAAPQSYSQAVKPPPAPVRKPVPLPADPVVAAPIKGGAKSKGAKEWKPPGPTTTWVNSEPDDTKHVAGPAEPEGPTAAELTHNIQQTVAPAPAANPAPAPAPTAKPALPAVSAKPAQPAAANKAAASPPGAKKAPKWPRKAGIEVKPVLEKKKVKPDPAPAPASAPAARAPTPEPSASPTRRRLDLSSWGAAMAKHLPAEQVEGFKIRGATAEREKQWREEEAAKNKAGQQEEGVHPAVLDALRAEKEASATPRMSPTRASPAREDQASSTMPPTVSQALPASQPLAEPAPPPGFENVPRLNQAQPASPARSNVPETTAAGAQPNAQGYATPPPGFGGPTMDHQQQQYAYAQWQQYYAWQQGYYAAPPGIAPGGQYGYGGWYNQPGAPAAGEFGAPTQPETTKPAAAAAEAGAPPGLARPAPPPTAEADKTPTAEADQNGQGGPTNVQHGWGGYGGPWGPWGGGQWPGATAAAPQQQQQGSAAQWPGSAAPTPTPQQASTPLPAPPPGFPPHHNQPQPAWPAPPAASAAPFPPPAQPPAAPRKPKGKRKIAGGTIKIKIILEDGTSTQLVVGDGEDVWDAVEGFVGRHREGCHWSVEDLFAVVTQKLQGKGKLREV
ncbi:hypothetical protein HK097_000686 [Rhizophlyctis rosea]|uniref:Uncharacterized protein n=1 Tax=Rhizophlyctis rosea TaxID=64517 RepID=A0AAD5S7T1_9FUNG|nr:hypothetical protein HK097_000686 [Rhizophlyctis rosea]